MAIKATFELEGADALKTIAALQKGLKNFGNEGTKSTKQVSTAFEVLKGVIGAQAVLKGLDLVSQGFKVAAKDALAFGKTLQEINSIAPRTAQETLVLKNSLIGISNEFGSGAQQNARAFYNIVSAGVQGTAKQLSVLETANKAAAAGLVDIDTSARVLVSSVNSYATSGLTASEASDILFNTVKEGITTFGELADNIGTVAPLASAAGISFSELAGTMAFLTKNGISTDQAATQVRAAISSIIKPAEQAQQAAKQLGIEFSTAGIRASGGFGKFLGEVIAKTGGSEVALAKLFPNVRALSGILAIAKGNFQDFNRILDETANSAGATNRALAIIQESAAFQFDKLTNQLRNFGLSVLTNFEKPIADALKIVNELVSEEGLGAVAGSIDTIIAAFQTFNAVSSNVRQFFNFLSTIGAEVALSFHSLDDALAGFGDGATVILGQAVVGFLEMQKAVNDARIAFNELTGDTEEANLLKKSNEEIQKNIDLNNEAVRLATETADARAEAAQKSFEAKQKETAQIIELAEQETLALQNEEKKRDDGARKLRASIAEANEKAAADAEQRRLDQAAKDEEAAKKQLADLAGTEEKKNALLTAFADARIEEATERAIEEKIAKELANEEDFLFLEENLGREATLKELARIQDIDDERKRAEEIKKLRAKADKEKQVGLLTFKKFEDLTNTERVAAQKSTLNNLANLETGNNKALFVVKKAAALSIAGINIAKGVTEALALGPILGPIAQAAIIASGAIQIAKIASSQPPPSAGGFQGGGIIQGPSQVGDQLTAQVNADEAVFNKRQQQNLFNAINNDNLGGGNTLNVTLEGAVGTIPQESIDSIIDQIKDRTEFGNKRLGA